MVERNKFLSKLFFILALLVIAYVSFILLKPYISSILTAIILAYISHPFYNKLNRYLKNRSICAFITCILIVVLLIVPMFFVAKTLVRESTLVYNNYIREDKLPNIPPEIAGSEFLNELVQENTKDAIQFISVSLKKAIQNIPKRIIESFITLIAVFYFLKDWEAIILKLEELVPLEQHHKKKLIQDFKSTTNAVVFGFVITAALQGLFGALGFLIFQLSSPLVWGLIMMILALIPFLGPALVWFPIGVIQLISGNLFSGIGLLLYGAIIISSIDNIVRPKIISYKSNIHPLLILLGVVGGLKLFGFIGIVIGPVVLVFLMTILKLYAE